MISNPPNHGKHTAPFYRTHRQSVTVGYTTCLFLFFFLAYWLSERDRVAAGVALAIVALLLGYFKWQQIHKFRLASIRANKNLPMLLTFMENGLLGETQHMESFRMWAGCDGYIETKRTIVMKYTGNYYMPIPKRVLDQPTLDSLKGLLRNKLTKL